MPVRVVKLGEVMKHVKPVFEIDDSAEYMLCRVRLHRRGVVLRKYQKGSSIKTKKQQLCKSGYFIVAEMDAKFGGYGFIPRELNGAIVSSHYYLFKLNETLIEPDYFLTILRTEILQEQIKAKGSTNYSSVRPKNILGYKIPLPSLEKQKQVAKRASKYFKQAEEYTEEQKRQKELVLGLRQAILQEAIEGKLTADWRKEHPDVEPASELLKRIAAEKAELVKQKKIRKQKPLLPISKEEIPFDIPDTWEWCRLGEITINSLGKMLDSAKNKGEYKPYLRNLNVQWYEVSTDDLKKMRFEKHEIDKYSVKKGDVVICEGGYPGQAAIWQNDHPIMFQKALHRVRFISRCFDSKLFVQILWLWDKNKEIVKYFTGAGIKHLTGKSLNRLIIPLSPLFEQQVLTDQVQAKLALCDKLEAEITTARKHAKHLSTAILQEVFDEK
jgi:type I restriction enzyme S subunit